MGVESVLTGIPEFDNIEVVKTGTTTLSRNAGTRTQTQTVAHNLGYRPAVLAFLDIDGVFYPIPFLDVNPNSGSEDGYVREKVELYVDSTNIVFTVEGYRSFYADSSFSSTIRYYLLRIVAKSQ